MNRARAWVAPLTTSQRLIAAFLLVTATWQTIDGFTALVGLDPVGFLQLSLVVMTTAYVRQMHQNAKLRDDIAGLHGANARLYEANSELTRGNPNPFDTFAEAFQSIDFKPYPQPRPSQDRKRFGAWASREAES